MSEHQDDDVLEKVKNESSEREPEQTQLRMIAFVNPHSGGKMGLSLFDALKKHLGDENVFNLHADKGPAKGLKKYEGTDFRCVVCGGDGTINWVLGAIEDLKMDPAPPMGIIPMGTGNDAARMFGWGHRYVDLDEALRCLERMKTCEVVQWDRWQSTILHPRDSIDEKVLQNLPPAISSLDILSDDIKDDYKDEKKYDQNYTKQSKFSNYLSFGVDAQTMFSFHDHRESHRECYCCRCCNMSWLGWWGCLTCCCCLSKPMALRLEHKTEEGWQELDISNYKSIVLLNIPSYAGGRNIWGTQQSKRGEYAEATPPSLSDGRLEVLAIENTCHLGCTIMKARRAVRIGQFKEVRITSNSPLFIQLDGEPYKSTPATYHIRMSHSVPILKNDAPREPCCCEL